ncbi:hypothetical protein M3Y96_00681600 [Aphelenchoides besseyi]|nr:hypothetical protein M3Y96_00681600 [Aphelenchoides besseyi]
MKRIIIRTSVLLALSSTLVISSPVPSSTQLPTPTSRDSKYLVLEQFHPLSSAFNQKDKARIHAVKSHPVQKAQNVEVLVDFGSETQEPLSASGARQLGRTSHFQLPTEKGPLVFDPMKHTTKSHWLDWTRWTECSDGERVRVRQCLEVKNVKCEGPSIETQKCYSFQSSNIPFAKDPLVIEKEISGV